MADFPYDFPNIWHAPSAKIVAQRKWKLFSLLHFVYYRTIWFILICLGLTGNELSRTYWSTDRIRNRLWAQHLLKFMANIKSQRFD